MKRTNKIHGTELRGIWLWIMVKAFGSAAFLMHFDRCTSEWHFRDGHHTLTIYFIVFVPTHILFHLFSLINLHGASHTELAAMKTPHPGAQKLDWIMARRRPINSTFRPRQHFFSNTIVCERQWLEYSVNTSYCAFWNRIMCLWSYHMRCTVRREKTCTVERFFGRFHIFLRRPREPPLTVFKIIVLRPSKLTFLQLCRTPHMGSVIVKTLVKT